MRFRNLASIGFLLALALPMLAQNPTTIPVGAQKLVDQNKQPLNGTVVITLTDVSNNPVTYTVQGGSPSTATWTATVKNGGIQPVGGFPYVVPSPRTTSPAGIVYRIQTYTSTGTLTWNLPLTQMPQDSYSIDGYIAQAGNPISGTGVPSLPHCAPGAMWTDITATSIPYACSNVGSPVNGIVWTQNPSQSAVCAGQAIAYPFNGQPTCIPVTAAYLLPNYVLGNMSSNPAPAVGVLSSGGVTPPNATLLGGTGTNFQPVTAGSGLNYDPTTHILTSTGGAANPAGPAFAVNFANAGVNAFQGDLLAARADPTAHTFASGSATNSNGNFFGPDGYIDTRTYSDLAVNLSAPASAPLLTAQATTPVLGTATTSGHSYQAFFSLVAWNGETALSPGSNIVASTGGVLLFHLPDAGIIYNARWTGVWLYLVDTTAGSTAYKACVEQCQGVNPPVNLIDPADQSNTFNGLPVGYTTALGAYSGTGATDKDGTTISAPTTAPVLSEISNYSGQTVIGRYTVLAGDGTQSAPSPASSSITMGAETWLTFQHVLDPLSGTVGFCDYLSIDGGTTWLFQPNPTSNLPSGCIPVHYTTDDIYTLNTTASAPTTGPALSTVSALQQAIDQAAATGSIGVKMPVGSGPFNHTVPILIRGNNSNATGLTIQCTGNGGTGVLTTCSAPYTGTMQGVDNIVDFSWNTRVENVNFTDPSNLAGCGLCFGNYQANEAFHFQPRNSLFQGTGTHGIGCLVDMASRGAGGVSGHSPSEIYPEHSTCVGESWGMESHGVQTFDKRAHNFSTRAANVAQIANSGDVRSFGVPEEFDGYNSDFHLARNVYHVTGEPSHPFKGVVGRFHVKFPYTELHNTLVYLSVSSLANFGLDTVIEGGRVTKNESATPFLLINNGPNLVTFRDVDVMQGDIYTHYGTCTVPLPSKFQTAQWRVDGSSSGFQRSFDSTVYNSENACPYYNWPTSISTGALGLQNTGGQVSKLETDTAGDLVMDSASGDTALTGALKDTGGTPVPISGGLVTVDPNTLSTQLVGDPTFATGAGWSTSGTITVVPGTGAVSSTTGNSQLFTPVAVTSGGRYQVQFTASISSISGSILELASTCSGLPVKQQIVSNVTTSPVVASFYAQPQLFVSGCGTVSVEFEVDGGFIGTVTNFATYAFANSDVTVKSVRATDTSCTSGSPYLRYDNTCGSPAGTLPTGALNQLLYYAAAGTTLTPLTLGTNLSITSGTLNAASTGATAFSAISSGTNTTATMQCGAGCVFTPVSTGLVNANEINLVQLATLATGPLYNTTSSGVPSIMTTAQFASFLGALTGCSTPGNTYAPATSTCVAGGGGSGNTTSTSLTTGFLPKASGANSIVNSLADDGVSAANTFSYSGTGGITTPGPVASTGTCPLSGSGTGLGCAGLTQAALPSVGIAGQDHIIAGTLGIYETVGATAPMIMCNAANYTTYCPGSAAAFQANGTALANQTTINFINSATNANGLIFTFSNPSVGQVKGEITGTYTGSAGSVANSLTLNNSNSGASSGATFNGSAAQTISANTLGAPSLANANTFTGFPDVFNGDAGSTPTTSQFLTSTNAGATSGIPSGYGCSIMHAFVSGSNYTAVAMCANSSGAILFYNSPAHALGSEAFIQDGLFSAGAFQATTSVATKQFIPTGTVPTMAPGAAAGTSPTCTTVTGTNQSSTLTCQIGTVPTTGVIATITFSGTLTTAFNHCSVQAMNNNAALFTTAAYTTTPTTTAVTIKTDTTAPTTTQTYIWGMTCM